MGARGGGFEYDMPFAVDLDVSVAMTVSLEDAAHGATRRVRLPSGKELNVRIPAGVENGQQIRLKGQGQEAPGHRPGDVLITVTIAPHPYFKVDGADLRLDLPITLYEAVLGGKVRVPTLAAPSALDPEEHLERPPFRSSKAPKGLAGRPVRHHAHRAAGRQRRRARGDDGKVARRPPLQPAPRPRVDGVASVQRRRTAQWRAMLMLRRHGRA